MPLSIIHPIHRHDCSGCEFLGRVGQEDVYQCDDIDLIRRYGSEESENKALPISVVRRFENSAEWHGALSLYDRSLVARGLRRA